MWPKWTPSYWVEAKEMLHCIADDLGDKVYILVAANTYELVSNESCMNVQTEYRLKSELYEKYKEFVLKFRQHKDTIDELAEALRKIYRSHNL